MVFYMKYIPARWQGKIPGLLTYKEDIIAIAQSLK